MSKSIKSFFQGSSPLVSNKKQRLETSIKATASIVSQDDESVLNDVDSNWLPCNDLELSWKCRLDKEFIKPYFVKLQGFLKTDSQSNTIYPSKNQIFSAFNMCSFDDVKVVVLGQDPYHGVGQAHGLAFSVQRGVDIPPSLKNMIKELKSDPAIAMNNPGHGNLEHWSRQGVLMLNTVLSVRKANANSHQKQGWEEFTDAVVRELATKEGLVYLLWGKPSQLKCKNIDSTNNTIIMCSHPSPLAAYKTDSPFIGSRCFSRCNEALVTSGKTPIDWTIR